MRVFITGGTGLVGRHLIKRLVGRGDAVTCLSRTGSAGSANLPAEVKFIEANPVAPGDWQDQVPGHDAVINLAGAPVFDGFWTKGRKRTLRRSRLSTTFNVVEAIERAEHPVTLVSASAVGFYGDGGDQALPETAQPGNGFLARLACEWEHTAGQAAGENVRVVIMRIGIVLAADGGALPKMLKPFKMGLGGQLGNGRQYFPWIHVDDLVEAFVFALENPEVAGPVNAVVPTPPTNREFTRALGKALDKPTRFPVPGFVLKLVMGEKAGALLESQRVVPNVLKAKGFRFRKDELVGALKDLLG